AAFVAASALMVVLAVTSDGVPAFLLFSPALLLALMALQVMLINANTAAMIPLGSVAGSGAALLGMIPMVLGSLIGALIDHQFDGTITPLSSAFLVAAVLTFVAIRYAARAAPDRVAVTPPTAVEAGAT